MAPLATRVCRVHVVVALLTMVASNESPHHHHHHHHRHHHHHHANGTSTNSQAQLQGATGAKNGVDAASGAEQIPAVHAAPANSDRHPKRHARLVASPQASDEQILFKLRSVEQELNAKERFHQQLAVAKGHLNVNGPLPLDFSDRFAEGVAAATGCQATDVELLGAVPLQSAAGVEEIAFQSRKDVVSAVQEQAANPHSKLATGLLHSFLVAHEDSMLPEEEEKEEAAPEEHAHEPETEESAAHEGEEEGEAEAEAHAAPPAEPKQPASTEQGPEVDMAMPYGDLEPFGREDTAQELTESSIRESNAMVDQLERAEVAEEKRAVFRALTRLRGAAITSFDGIARSQTGNVDDYARTNQWRKAHPVHHLANDEGDVSKWAFPED